MNGKAISAIALGVWLMHGAPLLANQCGHHHYDDDCNYDGYHGCGHHSTCARRAVPADQTRSSQTRAAAQTRAGKVVEVVYLPGSTKDTGMVEIRLVAGTEQVEARLGPAGFLKQNQMEVHEGDTVSVTGYWVTAGRGDMLVVNQIARQGRTVQLRDDWGRSAW